MDGRMDGRRDVDLDGDRRNGGGSAGRRGYQAFQEIAAGLLYPFFGSLLGPVIVGIAPSLSSVSVAANALRLRRLDL
jgi:hypothetical protein